MVGSITTGASEQVLKQLPDGYEISTDPQRLNMDVIHKFLSEDSYWMTGVPRDIVERSVQNSLCFGVYHGTEQVGLARLVTDYSTFALLADVFILAPHRGKGLSKALMASVMEHKDLRHIRRLLLLTLDAHGLYSQFGFKPLASPPRFMEILKADIYQTN
ncbi:GNAT family N-acetyltransferase [Pigmentiphaga aceris]|uniref:GNAT family N-acetyltransferase n=2 Tax=Pigmentiphaga aceris TaxID=1940612 RepID=A0A5C0B6B7_9BURK|nr:GNAT family N-acetyltransferase [Pigmentiphaga aceris]